MRRTKELGVGEITGDPRAGKGSAVKAIVEAHSGRVASLETGAGYRAVTKGFLDGGEITADMPRDKISAHLAGASFELIALFAALRDQMIEQEGLGSLYTAEVQNTVSAVSRVEQVRTAVKADFARKVEAVRDTPGIDALVVDGRQLTSLLSHVHGVDVRFRLYTACAPEEAALRECFAKGIDFNSPEGEAILAGIKRRIEEDATRPIDPVAPESEGIDYWEHVEAAAATNGHLKGRERQIANLASFAVRAGQQIVLDTARYREHYPDDPKGAMSKDITHLFNEAMALAT